MSRYVYRAHTRDLEDNCIFPSDIENQENNLHKHIFQGSKNIKTKYISTTESLEIAMFKYAPGQKNIADQFGSTNRGKIYAIDLNKLDEKNIKYYMHNDPSLLKNINLEKNVTRLNKEYAFSDGTIIKQNAKDYIEADKEVIIDGTIPSECITYIPAEIADVLWMLEKKDNDFKIIEQFLGKKYSEFLKDELFSILHDSPDKITKFVDSFNSTLKESNLYEDKLLSNFSNLFYEKNLNMSEIVKMENQDIDLYKDKYTYLNNENFIYSIRKKYIERLLNNNDFNNKIVETVISGIQKEYKVSKNDMSFLKNIMQNISFDKDIIPKDFSVKASTPTTKEKEHSSGYYRTPSNVYKISDNLYIKDITENGRNLENKKNILANNEEFLRKSIPLDFNIEDSTAKIKSKKITKDPKEDPSIKKDFLNKDMIFSSDIDIDKSPLFNLEIKKEIEEDKDKIKEKEEIEKLDNELTNLKTKEQLRYEQLSKVNEELEKEYQKDKLDERDKYDYEPDK